MENILDLTSKRNIRSYGEIFLLLSSDKNYKEIEKDIMKLHFQQAARMAVEISFPEEIPVFFKPRFYIKKKNKNIALFYDNRSRDELPMVLQINSSK